IDYERAVALLGYTHGALLDEVVDAIGANDAAGAFAASDRVVQTGQDPRRIVEDLLERLRDLIVVAASSPEAAAAVLRGVPADELTHMAAQAAVFGSAELSRVADLVNQTLTEMTGATSPRLHLELMLARVLVPSSDDSQRGALARVERLERRVGVTDTATDAAGAPVSAAAPAAARGAAPSPASTTAPASSPAPAPASSPQTSASAPASSPAPVSASSADATAGGSASNSARTPASPPDPGAGVGSTPASTRPAGPPAAEATSAPHQPVGPVTLSQMRDAWPEVLASLQRTKRSAWIVAVTAQVREFRDGEVLVLTFPSEQDVAGFRGGAPSQSVSELLRRAIADVLGVTVKFIAKADGGLARGAGAAAPAGPGQTTASEPRPAAPAAGAGESAGSRGGASTPSPPPADSATVATAPSNASVSGTASPGTVRAGTAPAGPVDSWATVTIPSDLETDAAAAPGAARSGPGSDAASTGASQASVATMTAVAEVPVADARVTAASDAKAPVAASVADAVSDRVVPVSTAADVAIATPDDTDAAPGNADAPPDDADAPPDDADAPPEDEEPPYAGPPPEVHASVASRTPAKRGTASTGGFQRYGEAVVREVLGATFLEEVEAPGRSGFGERG
ncbi:MAG TPA: DNA polymerase III subunit gamma and tau, partial [Agromyces sp.]|nr:DNA polymerase III subunit gamma and tau [Agromyces sp.]